MRIAYLPLVAALFLVCANPVHAATPYTATATIAADKLLQAIHSPARKGITFAPIRFFVSKLSGQGSVSVTLTKRKLPSAEACFVLASGECKKDRKVPVLFRGYVSFHRLHGAERRLPAAASVVDNVMTVHFLGVRHGRVGSRQRVYTVRWTLGPRNAVAIHVGSKPSSSFLGKTCSSDVRDRNEVRYMAAAALAPSPIVENYRVVTLSTDADPEWYARYGENSNVEIAATINAAEALYERQLGIRFSIVRQHVYTVSSPYVDTNSSKLLASFARNPENPANMGFSPTTFDDDVDLKHLFSGKDLDSTTIGLSYVGAVCWLSSSAYGLTQNVNRDLNMRTFAHEVGHSLGASHDTADPNSIMYPSLGLQNYFSQSSVDQINKQLATIGKCVSEQMLAPNLATATISLQRKLSKDRKTLTFSGILISASSRPLPGEALKLRINTKVVPLVTDLNGQFSYSLSVRRIKAKKLSVVAETNDGRTATSKTLKISVRV